MRPTKSPRILGSFLLSDVIVAAGTEAATECWRWSGGRAIEEEGKRENEKKAKEKKEAKEKGKSRGFEGGGSDVTFPTMIYALQLW